MGGGFILVGASFMIAGGSFLNAGGGFLFVQNEIGKKPGREFSINPPSYSNPIRLLRSRPIPTKTLHYKKLNPSDS